MELYKIATRVVFAFIFLQLLTRMAGNRTPGQGTVFDFVLALILGDMIDDCIWAEVPASQFVVGTGTLVAVHILLELAARRITWIERIVGSNGVMFMRDGKLLRGALRSERMSENDVEQMLRCLGLERDQWNGIKSGWIEQNGRPSVEMHEWAEPVPRGEIARVRRASR